MSSDDKQNDWSQDPSLSGIDFARLQALQQMASQSRGKSQAEMMPFLLSLMQEIRTAHSFPPPRRT